MLLRVLTLIFALNVLASPAMASMDCEMPNDADMSSMSHEMTSQNLPNSEMECCMDHDDPCNSTKCISTNSTTLPLLSLESTRSFAIDTLGKYHKDDLLSLYKIFLPINTPPPLV